MKIYVMGDKSRYQYLQRLLKEFPIQQVFKNTGAVERQDISIVHAPTTKEDSQSLQSHRIPLHTRVTIAGDSQEPRNFSMEGMDSYDKILILDEFPYRTDAELERTGRLSRDYRVRDYEVILIRKEGQSLKSDISSADDAMEQAQRDYEAEGHPVKTYSISSKENIFNYYPSGIKGGWKKIFQKRLQAAKDRLMVEFEQVFLLNYGFELKTDLEDSKRLDSYIQYARVRGRELRETFIVGFMHDFFRETALSMVLKKFIRSMYLNFTKEIPVWDREKDIDRFFSEVGISFSQKLYVGRRLPFSGDEADYIIFKNQNSQRILDMKNCAISFFSDELKEIMRRRILKRIERLEEILDEK